MNTLGFDAPRAPCGTAQIIPFPRSRRPAAPATVIGSGWYHDAAIAEERESKAAPMQPDWSRPPGRA